MDATGQLAFALDEHGHRDISGLRINFVDTPSGSAVAQHASADIDDEPTPLGPVAVLEGDAAEAVFQRVLPIPG